MKQRNSIAARVVPGQTRITYIEQLIEGDRARTACQTQLELEQPAQLREPDRRADPGRSTELEGSDTGWPTIPARGPRSSCGRDPHRRKKGRPQLPQRRPKTTARRPLSRDFSNQRRLAHRHRDRTARRARSSPRSTRSRPRDPCTRSRPTRRSDRPRSHRAAPQL